jgi:hypothetical protein
LRLVASWLRPAGSTCTRQFALGSAIKANRFPRATSRDARGACCLSEGRDREVVAHHQSGKCQGGISLSAPAIPPSVDAEAPR